MKLSAPSPARLLTLRRLTAVGILELAATTDRLLTPIDVPAAIVTILPPAGTYRHPRNGLVAVPAESGTAIVRQYREAAQLIPITFADRDGHAGSVIDVVSSPQLDVAAMLSWSPEGTRAVKEDGYRYVAPSFSVSGEPRLTGLTLVKAPIAGPGLPFPLVLDGSGLLNGEASNADVNSRVRFAATTAGLALAGGIASYALLRTRKAREAEDARQ